MRSTMFIDTHTYTYISNLTWNTFTFNIVAGIFFSKKKKKNLLILGIWQHSRHINLIITRIFLYAIPVGRVSSHVNKQIESVI